MYLNMERLLGAFYNKKGGIDMNTETKRLLFSKYVILATCPCVLAKGYTSDSSLIKDIRIYTVQTSNMQYAFEVKVYMYLEFYSKPFIIDDILVCNCSVKDFSCTIKDCNITSSCENVKMYKGVADLNS